MKLLKIGKSKHGVLIHVAFSWNPYNMFHGPRQDIRKNDPHYKKNVEFNLINGHQVGHDIEFLKSQEKNYIESYQSYVNNKSIRTLADLNKNKASPMDKDEESGLYCIS